MTEGRSRIIDEPLVPMATAMPHDRARLGRHARRNLTAAVLGGYPSGRQSLAVMEVSDALEQDDEARREADHQQVVA